jgi:surface polysaccharide O-acyltransferase-like enzyme
MERGNLIEEKTQRSSNFELLRIVAMIMIVAHHFSVHGGFDFALDSVTVPRLWIQFIQMGGKIGVDIFVLISGYFLVTSSKIKIFKILKLWLQLFFYSVLLYLVFILTGQEDFSIRTFINTCLPVLNSNWWFASTYFVLYLISPFINIFLKAMDKKQYQRFLCLLLVIWCFIPTFTRCDFQSNYLLWFIFLYSIAAYIRLWTDQSKLSEIYIYIYINSSHSTKFYSSGSF